MTNKEAVEILKPLTEYSVDKNGIGTFPMVSTPLQAEALTLAIEALEVIDNAPTTERPQGEWVYIDKEDKEKGYGGYCSEYKCDMPIFNEDWKWVYCETNFCPNCGADMRKGEEE